MINSISNSLPQNNVHQSSSTSATAKKAEPQPQAQTSKTGALSQDQVTLKSTGNANHESGGK
jgi:hypothetical protein